MRLFLAAALLGLVVAPAPSGCGKDGTDGDTKAGARPESENAPAGKPPAPAPPDIDVPPAWDPSPEEIRNAPETLHRRIDPYTVRFLPGPSRSMLEKKSDVYRFAWMFFKGSEDERQEARKALVELGLPTARFLMDLPGLLVPESGREPPDPDDFEYMAPEDHALEVIKDIQERVLEKGDVNGMMAFFAAASDKKIDLDVELAGTKKEIRMHRVHFIPALWRVGDALGCDMDIVHPDAETVSLRLPVLIDMTIHGEDAGWLLDALARLGEFEADIPPSVKTPLHGRIRATTYEEAFRIIAERAGYQVEKTDKGFKVID